MNEQIKKEPKENAADFLKNIQSMNPDDFSNYWDNCVPQMFEVCRWLIELENVVIPDIITVIKRRMESDEACGHPFDEDLGELLNKYGGK